jgi:gamma-glutamyltranspeptidase/glutathione hydrolase
VIRAPTWRYASLCAAVGFAACDPASYGTEHPDYGPSQISRSALGMVVSGAPLATDAGRRILESGGNAVDAAVATAFALAVVEPSMSGLGGRTQILIRTGDNDFVGIDGTTEVPAGAPVADPEGEANAYGYETVGIPGTVAALAAAATSYGTKPLAELILPALELAEGGFPLPAEQARRFASAADELSESVGARMYFLAGGFGAPTAGEQFIQHDLAVVLRAISDEGPDVFYRGWIAESIAVDMRRNGGFVAQPDLAAYVARPSPIVFGNYRGYDLMGTYLPASGATTIEALHILEQFDLAGRAGSSEWLALIGQALLLSFEDRVADLGPPEIHAQTIVSKQWAALRAAAVRDPAIAQAGAVLGPPVPVAETESPYTTHLSVADSDGMLVALTQSLGPTMGSKVATPGLGFLYAATMGYLGELAPGDRPFSSQSPFIVMRGDEPAFVLGASGARRIISAIVSVLSRVMDQEMSLAEAMAQPRLHPTGGVFAVEMHDAISWSASAVDDLRRFGFMPDPRSTVSFFARIHGIAWDAAAGEYIGVADPRWVGTAAGQR